MTRRGLRAWALPGLLVLLGGCAYDPGYGAGPAYHDALAACRKTAGPQADAMAKRRFYTFVSYPVSEPIFDRRAVRDCLAQKGFKG